MESYFLAQQKADQIRNAIGPVIEAVGRVAILNDAEFKEAANLLADADIKLRLIEERRVTITGPLNESLRQVNAIFKEVAAPLLGAKNNLAEKMKDYHRRKEIERQQQEREAERLRLKEKKRLEEEKQAKLAEAAEKPEEAAIIQKEVVAIEQQQLQVEGLQLVEAKKDTVVTDAGATVSMRKVKKWKIFDEKQVPDEFWIIDESAITKAVAKAEDQPDGTPAIPGIYIYFDSTPVTRK